MILALTSISSWYGSYSALGFPVMQYLEPLLTHRDVNFLSTSLDIALLIGKYRSLRVRRPTLVKPSLSRRKSGTTWQVQERTMGVLSRTAPPGTHDSV